MVGARALGGREMTLLDKLKALEAILVDVDDEHDPDAQDAATAKLASLATHIPALVEALEGLRGLHWIGASRQGRKTLETEQWREGDKALRDVATVLRELEEALDA